MSPRDDGQSDGEAGTTNDEPAVAPDTAGDQEPNQVGELQPLNETEDLAEAEVLAEQPLHPDLAWLWTDPFPCVHGVLLNDYIERYSQLMGLINTTDGTAVRDHVEPAAYTLRVGNSVYADGQERRLAPGEVIEIPSNGLVYVSTKEELRIPYYMIARMNLRVKQVYRGLLLGTGPQVDPGFRGHLNCPIHNLTDTVKVLEQDERLATIDFIKTTPFGVGTIAARSEEELLSETVSGRDGVEMKKWKGVLRHVQLTGEKTITPMLPNGESVRSSLSDVSHRLEALEKGLNDQVKTRVEEVLGPFREEVRERVTTLRNWGGGLLAAALIAGVVTAFTIFFQLYAGAAAALVPSDSRLDKLSENIAALETQVAAAGTATDAPSPTGIHEARPTPIPTSAAPTPKG